MASHSIPVILELPHRISTDCQAELMEHSGSGRALRAAKALGICWLCAFPLVFIPIIHFIGPITLLTTGIVLFIKRIGERVTLHAVRGECPSCKETRFACGGRWVPGRKVQCEQCGETPTVTVRALTSSPA